MTFDPKCFAAAIQGREEKRRLRDAELSRRREEVYKNVPGTRELDAALRRSAALLVYSSVSSSNSTRDLSSEIRSAWQKPLAEFNARLIAAGYPADYLDPPYDCPLCKDSGYVGTEMCECLIRECTERQIRELSYVLDITVNSFANFRLDLYSDVTDPDYGISPRDNICFIYGRCLEFAKSFGEDCGDCDRNLLFSGPPGLGKTFLSGCIAGEAVKGGVSVVYDTAVNVIFAMEKEKFGQATDETRMTVKRALACDLLILDDLGSEMLSQFSVSAVYSLINDRLVKRKRTIISTNLRTDELSGRYGAQTASRLLGEYAVLKFFGDDIRRLADKKRV